VSEGLDVPDDLAEDEPVCSACVDTIEEHERRIAEAVRLLRTFGDGGAAAALRALEGEDNAP